MAHGRQHRRCTTASTAAADGEAQRRDDGAERIERRRGAPPAPGCAEGPARVEAVAVGVANEPLDEPAERHADQHGEHRDGWRPAPVSRAAAGPVRGATAVGRSRRRSRPPLLRPRPPPEQQRGHGERAGGRPAPPAVAQVEGLGREPADLHLERRVAGPTEDADDAERREREQEHDRRRGHEGGPQQRERDLAQGTCHGEAPSVRAASSSAGVEVGPQARRPCGSRRRS